MGINALDVKQSNVHTILWTLCSCKTSTVKDLALMAGLSNATVGSILNGLVESKEVLPGEPVSSTGGRPFKVYAFNAEYAHVLALSARVRSGENIIHACVGNLYGEAVWQGEQCFDGIRLPNFEVMVDLCLRAYPTIRVLSFAIPGAERNGVVVSGHSELIDVPFAEHFQKKYQLPVILENDVNAAVFGYSKRMEPTSAVVGLYFPRSFPGAGIMIDGKILKGADGFAGEVSLLPLGIDWLTIDYEDPQEACPAIAKMIRVACSIINPNHIVLYGDFFTAAFQETLQQILQSQAIQNIIPFMNYQSDLDCDISSGLIAQAISVYRRRSAGKYQEAVVR